MTAPAAPDPEGLRVARQVAQWYIGDSAWAEMIIDAYLNPAKAAANLKKEKEL